MEKVTLTLKEVNEKSTLMGSILTEAPDKLNYAVKKVFSRIEAATKAPQKEYNQKLEDLRIKYASTYPQDHPDVEKRGLLITNEKGAYSYTKEATQDFNNEVRPINQIFEEQTIQVEPYEVKTGKGWERVSEIDAFIKDELKELLFTSFNIDEEFGEDKPIAKMKIIQEEKLLPEKESIKEYPGIPVEEATPLTEGTSYESRSEEIGIEDLANQDLKEQD